MDIYDANGNLLTEAPDLTRGYLTESTRTVHHDAVEGVAEEGHWAILAEYPNGGKDVEWVVDVPGVIARDAYDEEVPIQIYTEYTEEEYATIHAHDNDPTPEERIAALEEQNRMLMECLLEMSELVYS